MPEQYVLVYQKPDKQAFKLSVIMHFISKTLFILDYCASNARKTYKFNTN